MAMGVGIRPGRQPVADASVWEELSQEERDHLTSKVEDRRKKTQAMGVVTAAYNRMQRDLGRIGYEVSGSLTLDAFGNIACPREEWKIESGGEERSHIGSTIPSDRILREMPREQLVEWLDTIYQKSGRTMKFFATGVGVTVPTIMSWRKKAFLPGQHHRENLKRLLSKIRDGAL